MQLAVAVSFAGIFANYNFVMCEVVTAVKSVLLFRVTCCVD
jgi:hypothetical protein